MKYFAKSAIIDFRQGSKYVSVDIYFSRLSLREQLSQQHPQDSFHKLKTDVVVV